MWPVAPKYILYKTDIFSLKSVVDINEYQR